ncbi:Bro-N domain-containing protein [bacterium]|nr:Bro-N domain-containing protein [bacterium]MBU3929603.1 Bro-N domain-containing protein [bacterium]MBU4122530.1 Bro-N domain-containing protein [bacterium]
MKAETHIAIFKGKGVRKTIHNKEWWFSVVDVVAALTDSANPRDYWYKMKVRVKDEDRCELSTICRQLKLESADGKKYETDCANTEGIFRIVQSIPTPVGMNRNNSSSTILLGCVPPVRGRGLKQI